MHIAIRNILTVTKQTCAGFFLSPMAYVMMITFLVLSGLYGFMLGNFMSSNDATLYSFLDGYRWVFLILIPPLGMQLWSDERRGGTFEILMTLPVQTWQSVVGKFLGGLLTIMIALALTFPLVITVCYLGEPDIGSIITGYIGAVLLAGAYLALCSMASAITQSQSIALVLGLIMCVGLNLFGLQSLTDLLTGSLAPLATVTQNLSIRLHYAKFLRGILDLYNIYYFVAIMILGLNATCIILWIRRAGGLRDTLSHFINQRISARTLLKTLLHSYIAVVFLAVILVCGGIITHDLRLRVDLTEESVFTLSSASHKAISNLENPTVIRFYVSRDKIKKWPQIENYAKRIEDLIAEYAESSHGKITIEKYDITPRTVAEESAIIDGISGIHVENIGKVWFGLVVATQESRVKLPDLMPITESRLEYEITRAILQLNTPQLPTVGIWSPLPVAGIADPGNPRSSLPQWSIIKELRKLHHVVLLPENLPEISPQNIPVLVLIHPYQLNLQSLYAIDQYLMRGGKLVVFADPNCYYAAIAPKHFGLDIPTSMITSGFTDFYPQWGVRITPNKVVADMTIARINEESKLKDPCIIEPSVGQKCLNTYHPITRKLRQLLLCFSGDIDGTPKPGITFTPLIQTTTDVANVDNQYAQKRDQIIGAFVADGKVRTIAAEVSGKFNSIFPGGMPRLVRNFKGQHLTHADTEAKVILVSDVDMLFDAFSNATISNIFDPRIPVLVPNNDNMAFFFNAIDYLNGVENMINVRGERALVRPFTRLQSIKSNIEQKVIAQERDFINQLAILDNQLSDLRRDPNSDVKEIELIETEINKIIDTITNIDIYRSQIASLENQLFFWNVIAIPILVAIFAILFLAFIYYRRRAK